MARAVSLATNSTGSWFLKIDLGRKDSNLGMPGPEPGALPLGDAPKYVVEREVY